MLSKISLSRITNFHPNRTVHCSSTSRQQTIKKTVLLTTFEPFILLSIIYGGGSKLGIFSNNYWFSCQKYWKNSLGIIEACTGESKYSFRDCASVNWSKRTVVRSFMNFYCRIFRFLFHPLKKKWPQTTGVLVLVSLPFYSKIKAILIERFFCDLFAIPIEISAWSLPPYASFYKSHIPWQPDNSHKGWSIFHWRFLAKDEV